jgi:predicted NUDIX family NTP pyrophosphohydrolase
MIEELRVVLVRRETFYHEGAYVRGLENLAAAVLLFHRGGPWTAEDQAAWVALTGTPDVTTKALCDFARKVQGDAGHGERGPDRRAD